MRSTLLRRQYEAASAASTYDPLWLLLIIPIVLLFCSILGATLYLSHRRKKRMRRSILRNLSLVRMEQEKERAKLERRLSRNNTISSRLSRMTSTRSGTTRASSLLEVEQGIQKAEHDIEARADLTQPIQLHPGVSPDRPDRVSAAEAMYMCRSKDTETRAEVIEPTPSIVISQHKVKIAEDVKPDRHGSLTRKPSSSASYRRAREGVREVQRINALVRSNSELSRHQSQRSSATHGTHLSTSPFGSAPPSSSGHFSIDTPATSYAATSDSHETTYNQESRLNRTFGEVNRLKQPSAARLSRSTSAVHRTNSKSSRRSSIRKEDISVSPLVPTTPLPTATINWKYQSQAAKWKASSSRASSTDDHHTNVLLPTKTSYSLPTELSRSVSSGAYPPLPASLDRKSSIGAAGSRFLESL